MSLSLRCRARRTVSRERLSLVAVEMMLTMKSTPRMNFELHWVMYMYLYLCESQLLSSATFSFQLCSFQCQMFSCALGHVHQWIASLGEGRTLNITNLMTVAYCKWRTIRPTPCQIWQKQPIQGQSDPVTLGCKCGEVVKLAVGVFMTCELSVQPGVMHFTWQRHETQDVRLLSVDALVDWLRDPDLVHA